MKQLLFVALAMLLTACEDNSTGTAGNGDTRVLSQAEERNLVEIRNLTPTEVTAGQATTFTLDVAYNLVTAEQGIINLGFNTQNVHSYTFTSEKKEVAKGYGIVSFTVTTTPVKWDNPDSFKISVSLSENPHPASWTPLATDAEDIVVTQAYSINRRSLEETAVDDAAVMPGFGLIEECFNDVNLGITYCEQF
jgi:hypothetical protein